MKHFKAIIVILILLLAFIVAVQNYANLKTPVIFSIDLLFVKYSTPNIPLAFVAVITFLIGVIVMGLYGMMERYRLKRQIKTLLGEVRERDMELDSLRNLPVTAESISSEQTSDTD